MSTHVQHRPGRGMRCDEAPLLKVCEKQVLANRALRTITGANEMKQN